MRLGIVGDDNSHVGELVRHLAGHPDQGLHFAAALAPSRDWGVPSHWDLADFAGAVDGVFVGVRDGRLHRDISERLLAHGLPVFVDKPLATTLEDARAILDAALAGGGRVTSFSALHWHPDLPALAALEPQAVEVSGPVDPASPYGGSSFYAPHCLAIVAALAPGALGRPVVDRDETGRTVVRLPERATPATITYLEPDAPFMVRLALRDGSAVEHEIRLDESYYEPAAARIVRFMTQGEAPLTEAELLAPVTVVEALLQLPAR